MEQKERYSLRELFNNLEITMTELSKQSGISDVTLGNIRKGQSARLNTINVLLRTFSQIYGIKFSLENVDEIIIQGKPVEAILNPTEQATRHSKSSAVPNDADQSGDAHNRHSKRSEDIPDDAPAGTVKMIDFSKTSGIPASTLGRWTRAGKIEVITVERVSGKGMQHFITPDGQKSAIELDKARKSEEVNDPAV